MKIIYMGTPDFAVSALEKLHDEGFEVSLVVTQQDKKKGRGKKLQFTPVKEKALELGLEVYQPEDINSDESYQKLRDLKPEFMVVAAYGQILKKRILDIPVYDCLNIHASLLPKYRGAAPINWAIINGEEETGITIMKMEEGLDTGPMILKKETEISWDDDSQAVHDRLKKMGSELVVEAIRMIQEGKAIYEPQDHKNSSYAPMLYKGVGNIDWKKEGREIRRMVMGLKPWPSAFTEYKEEKVKIHKVEFEIAVHEKTPGTVTAVSNEGIRVAVGDGFVIIAELQFPGKRSMTVKEFLLGNEIEEGYIF